MGYLVNDHRLLFEIACFLQHINCVVRNPAHVRLLPDNDELVMEVETSVVFDGDVIGLKYSMTLVREVRLTGVDRHGDGRRLEGCPGEFEEVKQAVENLLWSQANLALILLFDVMEDWLNGVAICIT